MSKLLLAMLRRFLTLGVEGDEDGGADPGGAQASGNDDTGTGDEGLDDMLDAIEPDKPAKKQEPTAADERALRLAAEARADAAERRANEYRPAPARASDPAEDAAAKELADARAAGWDAGQIAWLTRQQDAARSGRNAERTANTALQEAREISDKTQFDRLEASKPGIYKKYAGRVEKAVADAKAAGQPVPPRSVILRLMVGDDLMNGNIKAKAKPTEAPATNKVDRGRAPGARTDVSSKNQATTEREKRKERLRGVQI